VLGLGLDRGLIESQFTGVRCASTLLVKRIIRDISKQVLPLYLLACHVESGKFATRGSSERTMFINFVALALLYVYIPWVILIPMFPSAASFLRERKYVSIPEEVFHGLGAVSGVETPKEIAMNNLACMKKDKFITIGALFCLSSDILSANAFGVHRLEAFRYIVDRINHGDYGNIDNKVLVYNVLDTQSLPTTAESEALSMIVHHNISMVFGPNNSDEFSDVASLLSTKGLGCFSYSASSPLLNVKKFPNFIRIIRNDNEQNHVLLQMLIAMKWTFITAIFTEDEFGVAGKSFFLTAQAEGKIHIDCLYTMPSLHTDSDIIAIRPHLKAFAQCTSKSASKIVLVYSNGFTAQPIFSALSHHHRSYELIYVMSSWLSTTTTSDTATKTEFPLHMLTGSVGVIPERGSYPEFEEHFKRLNPSNCKHSYFRHYWEMQFRCLLPDQTHTDHVLAIDTKTGAITAHLKGDIQHGIDNRYLLSDIPTNMTSAQLASYLPICPTNISDRRYPIECTCTGAETLENVPLDSKTHYVIDAVLAFWYALQKILGSCEEASSAVGYDLCVKEHLSGMDIVNVVHAIDFEGKTGRVRFENGERIDPRFEIVQLNSDSSLARVGIWHKGEMNLNETLFIWKNGSTPVSELNPKFCGANDVFGAIWCGIIVIIFSATILAGVFVLRHHEHHSVKSLSPLFLLLILIGICFVMTGVVLRLIYPTQLNCIIKHVFMFTGFGLIFGSILAKNYRIYKIFHLIRIKTTRYSNREMFFVVLLVVLGEALFLLLYFFLEGAPAPIILCDKNDSLYCYIECEQRNTQEGAIIFLVLLVYNVAIIVLAAIFSLLVRNVRSDFNESRNVALLAYSCTLIIIVSLPLYFALGNTKNHACIQNVIFVVSTTLIPICCLVFLFLPIVRKLFKAKRQRSMAYNGRGVRPGSFDVMQMTSNTFNMTYNNISDHIYYEGMDIGERFSIQPVGNIAVKGRNAALLSEVSLSLDDQTRLVAQPSMANFLSPYKNMRPSRPFVSQDLWGRKNIVFIDSNSYTLANTASLRESSMTSGTASGGTSNTTTTSSQGATIESCSSCEDEADPLEAMSTTSI
jgi:hypothetical protein